MCEALNALSKSKSNNSGNNILNQDNWIFVNHKCRILDKIPDSLASTCRVAVLDSVDELLINQIELLKKIIAFTISNKKQLILLITSADKFLDVCQLDPSVVEIQPMESLSDDQLAKVCQQYPDINLVGQQLSTQVVLNAKKGGIYHFMHFASFLYPLLKLSKSKAPDRAESKTVAAYTKQSIKDYQAIYNIKELSLNLTSSQIIVVLGEVDTNINQLSAYLEKKITVITVQQLKEIESKININSEDAYEQLKNSFKLEADTFLILKGPIPDISDINDILLFLRSKHGLIILNTDKNIANNNQYQLIFSKLNVENKLILLLDFESRYVNIKPRFSEQPHGESYELPANIFSIRQPFNLTTCLTANAGTGKTTCFKKIISRWQKNIDFASSYHWLIYINMNNITLSDCDDNLEHVLLKYLKLNFNLNPNINEQYFLEKIIKYDIENGFIKLLLDGWDEVKGAQIQYCERFLKSLPSAVHFDVAMRSEAFHNFPKPIYRRIELQAFTEKDLKSYFYKALKKMVLKGSDDEKNEQLEHKLNLFVESIQNWLHSCNENISEVVKTPLLAYLLTESLRVNWLNWINLEDSTQPDGPWNENPSLSLAKLYEYFFIIKINIFLQKQIGVSRESTLQDMVLCVYLASPYLDAMSFIAYSQLMQSYINIKSQTNFDHLHKELSQFGIIISWEKNDEISLNYHYRFSHRTFEEYLATLYIIKGLNLPTDHPTHQQIKSVLLKIRFLPNYRVVWAFIYSMCHYGSYLLHSSKISADYFYQLIEPRDLIGVAQQNFLKNLGISKKEITIQTLEGNFLANKQGDSQLNPSLSEQLQELQHLSQKFSSRDTIYNLITKLSNHIKEDNLNLFKQLMLKLLNDYNHSYSVIGAIVDKLAASNIIIDNLVIDKLKGVVENKQNHKIDRANAVGLMLKVQPENLQITLNYYFQLLKTNIEDFIKCKVWACLKNIFYTATLSFEPDEKEKLFNGFAQLTYSLSDKTFSQEIYLYQAIMWVNMNNTTSLNTKSKQELTTSSKEVAIQLNLDRLDLLFHLLDLKLITFKDIDEQLISSVTKYDNRSIARNYVIKILDYLKVNNTDIQLEWSEKLLGSLNNQNSESNLFKYLSDKLTNREWFEKDEESHLRFWRVDAGIPIATELVLRLQSRLALAYLIAQIRFNIYRYDVNKSIYSSIEKLLFNHNVENKSRSRALCLYLIIEYFIGQDKNALYYLLNRVNLVRKILEIAIMHYQLGMEYPYLGLEAIFVVGFYFGLPVLEKDNLLVLQFPAQNGHEILLTSTIEQTQRAVKYISILSEQLHTNQSNIRALLDGFPREDYVKKDELIACNLNKISKFSRFFTENKNNTKSQNTEFMKPNELDDEKPKLRRSQ